MAAAVVVAWRGGEKGARRPGPEGQVLRHIPRCVLRNFHRSVLRRVLHVFALRVSHQGSVCRAWVPPLEDDKSSQDLP